MSANIELHEMTALAAGSDKTSGTVRFKNADNSTVDTADPLVVPAAGVDYSYTKQLRAYMEAPPVSSVSNLQWYTDGANGFGTGISVNAKNAGITWAANVQTLLAGTADLFSYTSGSPLDGDGTDTGPFEPGDDDSYIGDLIVLQMEIATTATNGVKPAETLNMSFDEV